MGPIYGGKHSMPGLTVKIGRMGSPVKEVALSSPAKVSDALRAAGLSLNSGETIAINGSTVGRNDYIRDGQRLFIVPAVSGGQ
jgi:sulfur carrier protein ThiS